MSSDWLSRPGTDRIKRINPFAMIAKLWPKDVVYAKQREIVQSVEDDDETYVTAGNKLGKDWIAAKICVVNFLRCLKLKIRCRIVTHSVAEHHLKVLWAEIANCIRSCSVPLLERDGGPLVINHMDVRRADERDAKNPDSYLVGRVSDKGEGLAGHHAEYTLFVGDESSGLEDVAYEMSQGWAHRKLLFGNPNQCTNFWRRGIKGGDVVREFTQADVERWERENSA